MINLDLGGFERYCKNIYFIKSINAYKNYLEKGVHILNQISSDSIEEFVSKKEKDAKYLKNEFTIQIEIQKLHNDLYNDFSSAAKKYSEFKNHLYPISRDEILQKYDSLWSEISVGGLKKLKNQNETSFTLEVNSTSLCVRGSDGNGQECMSVSKDKIQRILFEDEPYTYPSYEPTIINIIFGIYDESDYKKIVEELHKQLKDVNNLPQMNYPGENYIQFNILSKYGIHLELWLIDKDDSLYLDIHQEKRTKELNNNFIKQMRTIIGSNEKYIIKNRERNKDFQIIRQLKAYNKNEILTRVNEIAHDVIEMDKLFRKPILAYFNSDQNLEISAVELKGEKIFMPLNQILYGPPGTGKTYNTINKALEIIFKSDDPRQNFEITDYQNKKYNISYIEAIQNKDRVALTAIFDLYKEKKQIVFTTFHQSYGYEEFVEGIRAIPVGEEGNEDGEEMIYAVKEGVFKRMSKASLENYTLNSNIVSPKRKFFLHAKTLNIHAEMIEEDSSTYRVLKGSKIRKGQAASFENYNYVALKNKLLGNAKLKEETEFYILEEDYIFQSMSAASSVILGRQSNGYNDWKEISDEGNLFTLAQEKRNYILIIDEINRGNISKIFGELITLIEPSKRIGEDEEIKVTLPYSGDSFGVPNNLYIIGTMNTADRSIALMDTALRRRFEFTEMMPDLEILSSDDNKVKNYYSDQAQINDLKLDEINIRLLLKKMNERIEYLYDRDHTVGHAYFMDLKDSNKQNLETLSNIFKNKIIPLLQEYFYDDWEKIRLVLGDNQKEKNEVTKALQFIKIKEGYDLKTLFGDTQHELLDNDDSTKVYAINKDAFLNPESYIKIYG